MNLGRTTSDADAIARRKEAVRCILPWVDLVHGNVHELNRFGDSGDLDTTLRRDPAARPPSAGQYDRCRIHQGQTRGNPRTGIASGEFFERDTPQCLFTRIFQAFKQDLRRETNIF